MIRRAYLSLGTLIENTIRVCCTVASDFYCVLSTVALQGLGTAFWRFVSLCSAFITCAPIRSLGIVGRLSSFLSWLVLEPKKATLTFTLNQNRKVKCKQMCQQSSMRDIVQSYFRLWASVELAPLALRLGRGEQRARSSTAGTSHFFILRKVVFRSLAFVATG